MEASEEDKLTDSEVLGQVGYILAAAETYFANIMILLLDVVRTLYPPLSVPCHVHLFH